MNVKGVISLVFGLSLVASGIWLTLDQAKHEQQWNLKKDAANGVMSSQLPGDKADEQKGSDDSGIVSMLP